MSESLQRLPVLELTPAFYSSIVRHGSEMITVIDQEGTYLYASDSITTLLGHPQGALLGTNVMALVHEEDLGITVGALRQLVGGGEKQISLPPFRYKAHNGSWHWLSCVATNMLDNPAVRGIVTNSRDITAKMEVIRLQRESRAYYKALYFDNPDLVVTLSTTGEVESCNNALFEMTGYTPEENGNRLFVDYVLPPYRQECLQVFSEALQGKSSTFHTRILKKQGEERDLQVTVVPVILDGKVRAVQCIAKDTTSEKAANNLVKAQAQQLHNILESITEAFFALDSQWRYSFGNSVFARFLNREIDDLMQRCIWEEYPWLVGSLFYQKCHEVAATGKSTVFEEEICEMEVILRFTVSPFDGGVTVSFSNITAQVAAQEELRKLSLVASKTNNGVIITDRDSHIEWVNEAFTTVTGYTLQEIKGRKPSEILTAPGTNPEVIRAIREQLAQGIPVQREFLSLRKCGERLWADLSITPVRNDSGEIIKHVYIHTDITKRKLDQEHLLKATKHLYLQNQDLQQFNYIVSHNLRAPVANLVGLSTMLQKLDRHSNRFDMGLQNLEKSARRLDDVIGDLNKILAVRTSNEDDVREQVALADVTAEVLQSMQHLLEESGAQVSVDLQPTARLWANKAYVYSILHNLVSNAIKYKSSKHSLLLEIISVRTDNGITLQIRDNGSGMDLESVGSKLFQLYQRFHQGQDGKGIGLYLVKMQVEAIGGKIEVESKLGTGTTFTIHFESALHDKKSIHN
ncbi:PAS domain-containing sensor histidine kinase [Pontibacter sp. JH31]|uniref:histidine kinase n=1 Tax=Pontibacter aquaedesilientis TaxID=2766980 RepID=A0ABR7XDZ5_9BACT|nr:PAS domain-containing sensor histidine kinase [Pontibacter aquaedesilientis]MBD1396509.1 PAS domain-containing sensor histidine kinase [Pontibacter aquaedesilientis]